MTPAAMMPPSDHSSEAGAVCSDLTMIQHKNPAAPSGRMPMSTVSHGSLAIRRR
jgi:hypothetical protein